MHFCVYYFFWFSTKTIFRFCRGIDAYFVLAPLAGYQYSDAVKTTREQMETARQHSRDRFGYDVVTKVCVVMSAGWSFFYIHIFPLDEGIDPIW